MRLTDRQKEALVTLYRRAEQHEATNPRLCWVGSSEASVAGTTLDALAARGLVKSQWIKKPYPRIVGRITADGARYVRENDLLDKIATMRER